MQTDQGYKAACQAIAKGTATAHPLWVLLSNEADREGFALRPMPWEGPGEYQSVKYGDGRQGFVRIPFGEALMVSVPRAASQNEAQRRRVSMERLCANIPTADLEKANEGAGKTLTAYGQACKDRDTLLAALRKARAPIASDAASFSTYHGLLAVIDAAIEGVGK